MVPLGRALRTATSSPACGGAAALVGLFLAELASASQMGMMGLHDADIQRHVVARFARFVVLQQLAIGVAYASIGGVCGLVVGGALLRWDSALGRTTSARARWLVAFSITAAVEVWRVMVTLIHYPQLFDDALYRPGGLRRWLIVSLTDHVPRLALEGAGWAVLAALGLGWLLTRRGRRDLAGNLRVSVVWLRAARWGPARAIATLTVASLAAVAWSHRASGAGDHGPLGGSRGSRPNVLLLAVDSLRKDRVGRGSEPVAPHMAALAAEGVQFDAAHVTIPRTFPSWMTLLTGVFPAHHGVRTTFPSAAERAAVSRLDPLPARFARAGYRTAVLSDFAGEIFSRVDVGFEERDVPRFDVRAIVAQAGLNLHPGLFPYLVTSLGHRLSPALEASDADPDRLADRVLGDLTRNERPFFLTVFFSTAHLPYAAPDPWYRRFTDPGYHGRFRYRKPAPWPNAPDVAITGGDIQQVRALYDGSVAATDAAVGRILEGLRDRGLDRSTIVVLLADHGENLYEGDEGLPSPRRGMGHGEHLHGDNALSIPFVVYDPVHRFPAHDVPGIVRDVDVAPTLAALAELPRSDGDATFDGVDLAPMLRGDTASLGLVAYAESGIWFTATGPGFEAEERLAYPEVPASLDLPDNDDIVLQPELERLVVAAKHRAVRTEQWKLYYAPTAAGPRLSLYDVHGDPDERANVLSEHAHEAKQLLALLDEWLGLDGLSESRTNQ